MKNAPDDRKKPRVLIIEDEDGARLALTRILRSAARETQSAADGKSGIELLVSSGPFDIVFTDLSLPGMSGWEVAAAVREKSPGTPVVLLSGWDVDKNDERIKGSGVARVLAKPVKLADMVKAINDLVK